jgi:hypothetical protein
MLFHLRGLWVLKPCLDGGEEDRTDFGVEWRFTVIPEAWVAPDECVDNQGAVMPNARGFFACRAFYKSIRNDTRKIF